jgi:hypothetical protein
LAAALLVGEGIVEILLLARAARHPYTSRINYFIEGSSKLRSTFTIVLKFHVTSCYLTVNYSQIYVLEYC